MRTRMGVKTCAFVTLFATLLVPGWQRQAEAAPNEQTVVYLGSVAHCIDQGNPQKSMDPIQWLRVAAWQIRRIPTQSVERTAVSLAWRTADHFEKCTAWAEQYQQLLTAGYGGAMLGAGVLFTFAQPRDRHVGKNWQLWCL